MKGFFTITLFLFFGLSQAQFDNKQIDKIDIVSYDFNIKINDTTDHIKASTRVEFIKLKPVKELILNLKKFNQKGFGMQVSKISDDKSQPVDFKHENDKLFIDLTKQTNDTLSLVIYYNGKPEDGLYIRKNKYGKRTFFGDNWPNRAQYWLPVIDHPSDKALVSWTVTAPKHYEIVASGRLVYRISQDKTNQFYYKTKVPLPTKVMVFAAANFNIKNFEKLYLQQNCVPVSSWIYADSPVEGFDDYKSSLKTLKYFDSLLGPYVYEKLANVQSNTRFGGMENAGNIFYYENSVDGTKSVENLVAHEVAHQWFGNTVTEKNWRDIWLSEGFATYLTDLYLEHFYGKEKLKERMALERQKVINYHKRSVKPVVYDETDNLFKLLNRNSYEKGAWILHMFRQQTGDQDFFKILKQYYQTYKLRNASTNDFIRLVNQITGQDYQDFFNQWLYRDDIPEIHFSYEIDEKKRELLVKLKQNKTPYQLQIPFRAVWQNGQTDFIFNLTKTEQTEILKLPENFNPKTFQLQIDPNVQVLFKRR